MGESAVGSEPSGTMRFRMPISTAEPRAAARRVAEALGHEGGVLFYALGGGLGHLTRALAIRRRWTRESRRPFTVLTNCRVALPEPGVLLDLSGEDPAPAGLAALVAALVEALRPEALVVDAFPAGILGELAPVLAGARCRKVALLRRLQAAWVSRWDLPAVLPAYDRVWALEPGAAAGTPVAPPLIRDAPDLLPAPAARRALGAEGEAPVVAAAVTAAGHAETGLLGLAARLGEARGAEVRLITPLGGLVPGARAAYPLLETLGGVDVLLGPAGFNLYHEAAATRTPAIWVPQPRRYDDQAARCAGDRVARSPAELAALLDEALAARRPAVPLDFPNGAGEIARDLAGATEAPT